MTKTTRELEIELDDIRTALAVASGATPDTVTAVADEPGTPVAGDVVHVLKPLVFAGQVRSRGESITLTAEIIDGTRDREGRSSLAGLVARGILGLGDFPASETPWSDAGDQTWSRLFVEARDRARAIPDREERARAEAALVRRFGPTPSDWHEPPRPVRSKWSY